MQQKWQKTQTKTFLKNFSFIFNCIKWESIHFNKKTQDIYLLKIHKKEYNISAIYSDTFVWVKLVQKSNLQIIRAQIICIYLMKSDDILMGYWKSKKHKFCCFLLIFSWNYAINTWRSFFWAFFMKFRLTELIADL